MAAMKLGQSWPNSDLIKLEGERSIHLTLAASRYEIHLRNNAAKKNCASRDSPTSQLSNV